MKDSLPESHSSLENSEISSPVAEKRQPARLAVLLSFSGQGGVERMVMKLVREFVRRGVEVDLLVIRAEGPYLDDVPEQVRLIRLQARHTLTAIPELVEYMRNNAPTSMLVAKDRAGRAAICARSVARSKLPVFVRLGTNLSESLKYKPALSRWSRLANMRRIYAKVDGVIGISEGVCEDIRAITGIPDSRCKVISNPVVEAQMFVEAEQPLGLDWYKNKTVPVIVSAGRLSLQKDFATLLKAFALLRQQRDARLVILGEGGKRAELESLVRSLKLEDSVAMPGFQANPYNWIAQADLFVLSSRWEGSGNVLTEALALGVPAVSTDCPSGPSETLQGGKFGKLVPVGDEQKLAEAMAQTLDKPLAAEVLQQAVVEFHLEVSAAKYLEVLAG